MFAGSEILEAEFLPSVVSGPVDTQFPAGGGDGGTYDRDVRVHDAESRFSGSKKNRVCSPGRPWRPLDEDLLLSDYLLMPLPVKNDSLEDYEIKENRVCERTQVSLDEWRRPSGNRGVAALGIRPVGLGYRGASLSSAC